jgi:hypothetical protein
MMPYLQHDNGSWRGSASVVKPKRIASVKLAPTYIPGAISITLHMLVLVGTLKLDYTA